MYPTQSNQGDESVSIPAQTCDRLRRRPKVYGRSSAYMYYGPNIMHTKKKKSKTRASASTIAKRMKSRRQPIQNLSNRLVATKLRRSTRQRRIPANYRSNTDSSRTGDEDLMRSTYPKPSKQINSNIVQDGLATPKHKKTFYNDKDTPPRREGLRPHHSKVVVGGQLNLGCDDEEDTSEEKVDLDETEIVNDMEDSDADDDQNEECEDEDEGEADGDDEDGDEQEEGRRRYDLRNRAEVHTLSMEEGKGRPRSPRMVLHQGIGLKVGRELRKGGSRVRKRHRLSRVENSDDSLLVDELDQAPSIPWGRSGSRSGPPWWGLDMHGTNAWGLNVAASGWGHQSDSFASLTSGIQTAGPSSKGGADIQPLQIDESVSFNDIGGLSEYIDALKEMVFFPLLYPDFFSSYHITPPRGVLLCGPPGTGKTLIARALACAASKAGQKVNFYMRKGADVLSKWVGEAERQLKLLFEEAQKNQPSIIFFDEIDGLAPVRSSKQEQIHNSIVSTLLALMDGLDSRGQVVLIGATNRIDAIDGALRRPGRFDREFSFPLPGCDARAEILDIHTRKWKHCPSKELRLELAAACVGYCGADLKALCTEAAIHAFREKYPQVYTSDDKFLIDVDSVKVKEYHFLEAMSTITPAAHRGTVVHSRPLSSVVAPCLKTHLRKTMNLLIDVFPLFGMSSELTKVSFLSYGSATPLLYRPRFLLCGSENVGLDHMGPAILHELEKFPVHALGLPSLLSDPSAKTPEEALVHIFGEARRTTPSILYLPQFHLWWDTADEILRAVLLSLLEELPSDLPILLLGTSSSTLVEMDEKASSVFPHSCIYKVNPPSKEDRSLFFDRLIAAALSVSVEGMVKNSQESAFLPELPKAPKVENGPKASELRAKVEAEQHALRRMRMCLRDICNRILYYDKRFSVFHYPVLDEDAPNYRMVIQNPMDVATLLQRVDSGQYITSSAFMQDVDLIVSNAKAYNGDDYNGARIVSRAYELRDAVQGMLSQMDPGLVTICDKIVVEGGPLTIPSDLVGSPFTSAPVVQLGAVTRACARLRNVQPEVNMDQSYEALKRPKKDVDAAHQTAGEGKTKNQDSGQSKTTLELEINEGNLQMAEPILIDDNHNETCLEASDLGGANRSLDCDVTMLDGDISGQVEILMQIFVDRTENYGIPQLERVYTRIMKGVFESKNTEKNSTRSSILKFLLKFAEDERNF